MLYLAADHAGFDHKEYIAHKLAAQGIAFEDFGAFAVEPGDDFTPYARRAAKAVVKSQGRAILVCGSGQGMCMAANRFKGVRATVGWNQEAARRSREEDDSNILCLPARQISKEEAWENTATFLSTSFSHLDRYKRRIKQLDEHVR